MAQPGMKSEAPFVKIHRHWMLTTYLVISAVSNIGLVIVCLIDLFEPHSLKLNIPHTAVLLTVLGLISNVVCIFAIFNWRKVGFWGLCILAIIAFFFNISMGATLAEASAGLLGGPAVAFALLNMGGKDRAWPHLV